MGAMGEHFIIHDIGGLQGNTREYAEAVVQTRIVKGRGQPEEQFYPTFHETLKLIFSNLKP